MTTRRAPEVRQLLRRNVELLRQLTVARKLCREASWVLLHDWSGGETWNPCPAGIAPETYRDDLLVRLTVG